MKSEVLLCDDCKKVVAIHKCNVCDTDLCNKCKRTISIRLKTYPMAYIIICKSCSQKIDKEYNELPYLYNRPNPNNLLFNYQEKIKKFILPIIHKSLMLSKLEVEDKNE